ncbi:MAG: energy transducer TonB [Acidobacteriota bacterium]
MVLHLILLLLVKVPEYRELAIAQAKLQAPEETKPMKFTFVDVPFDREAEPKPETDRYSDKNRRAAGVSPLKEGEGKSDLPYSEGRSPEFSIPSDIAPPKEVPPQKEIPQAVDEQALEKEESQLAPGEEVELKKSGESPLAVGIPKGEEATQPQPPQAQLPSTAPHTTPLRDSLLNLDRYIDSQGFDNQNSTLNTDSFISFDTKEFDFGPYAYIIQKIVKRNWFVPYQARVLGLRGVTVLSFQIEKDGRITNLSLLQSSDIRPFDAAALNALQLSNPFPPLPHAYRKDRVGVKFAFFYNVRPPD